MASLGFWILGRRHSALQGRQPYGPRENPLVRPQSGVHPARSTTWRPPHCWGGPMSPDERNGDMWNQINNVSDVTSQPIQFPETKGKPSVQLLNADPALGPALVRIVMGPGDVIARHYHDGE